MQEWQCRGKQRSSRQRPESSSRQPHLQQQLGPAERQPRGPEERGGWRRQRLPQLAPAGAQQAVVLAPPAGAQHGGQRRCRHHRLWPLALLICNSRRWQAVLDAGGRIGKVHRQPSLAFFSHQHATAEAAPRSRAGRWRARPAGGPPPPPPGAACAAGLRPTAPQTACGCRSARHAGRQMD